MPTTATSITPVQAQVTSAPYVDYTQTDANTINWLVGCALFIGICAFIASTSKAGHALIYWSLMLLIILVGVTQAGWIAQELSWVNFNPPTYVPPQSTVTGQTAFSTPTFGPAGVIPL